MTAGTSETASLGFGSYLRTLRAQWRWIVACTLVGLLAGIGYLVLVPQAVTATTTLNLNAITSEPFSSLRPASGLIDGKTESDIARSHVVATAAKQKLGAGYTASDIRDATSVSIADGATVIRIMFTARTAELAIDGSNAVSRAYLDFRQAQAAERITTIVDGLNERITTLNGELVKANLKIGASPRTSDAYAQALSQQQQILTELDGLLSSRNSLQSIDTASGTVLTAAEDYPLDTEPSKSLVLLTGVMAGLVLGVIVAFARGPLVRRARSGRDVAFALDAPLLTRRSRGGAIPAAEDSAALAWQYALNAVPRPTALLVVDARSTADGDPAFAEALASAGSARVSRVGLQQGEAALLSALRGAQAAVVVFGRGDDLRRLRALRRLAESLEIPLLGCVEQPAPAPQRKPEPPTAVPEASATSSA